MKNKTILYAKNNKGCLTSCKIVHETENAIFVVTTNGDKYKYKKSAIGKTLFYSEAKCRGNVEKQRITKRKDKKPFYPQGYDNTPSTNDTSSSAKAMEKANSCNIDGKKGIGTPKMRYRSTYGTTKKKRK